MHKILLIDKPVGWTSFDVVAKIRGVTRSVSGERRIKVGHAGTLDPFATGLLIVLVGKENTAKQDSFMKQDKEYLATLRLGFTSSTGDPEGEIIPYSPHHMEDVLQDCHAVPPRNNEIKRVLTQFIGEISQIPPIYSAIKVDGKRAYQLAREGKEVEMKSRKVTVYNVEVENYAYPELKINVKCSSGTYIRTLAEDIGKALDTGAYLTELRRTQIGEYSIDDAVTVEDACEELSLLEKNS